MYIGLKKAAALAAVLALAACGGGGGGGSSSAPISPTNVPTGTPTAVPTGVPANKQVTFAPQNLTAPILNGDTFNFNVNGSIEGPINQIYLQTSDASGVFATTTAAKLYDGNGQPGAYFFQLPVNIRPSLPLGHHTGQIKVQLCKDQGCSAEYAGSPAYLPFDITVTDGSTPALSKLAGIADWTNFRGNSGHNGYVPVTLDPSRFSLRWMRVWDDADFVENTPIVAANNAVYFLSKFSTTNRALSLSEDTGKVNWQAAGDVADRDRNGIISQPAVSGSRLYFTASMPGKSSLWQLDIKTGATLGKTSFTSGLDSNWYFYNAPTVNEGFAYNGCQSISVCAFNESGLQWLADTAALSQWTPAVDADNVYTYRPAKAEGEIAYLFVLNKKTGVTRKAIVDTSFTAYNNGKVSPNATPVLGGQNDVILINRPTSYDDAKPSKSNALVRFDIGGKLTWSVTGNFAGTPAVANNVVYAIDHNNTMVTGYDEATGALVWQWNIPDATSKLDMLATNNLLFVSTADFTYAINLATRDVAWRYPKSGDLALSANGILYIGTRDKGKLYAFNTR